MQFKMRIFYVDAVNISPVDSDIIAIHTANRADIQSALFSVRVLLQQSPTVWENHIQTCG